jgi:hypothetical protein
VNCRHTILMEQGTCPSCDEARLVWKGDIPGNATAAFMCSQRVERYIERNPGCSAQDIYENLDVADIPMCLALSLLVHSFRIVGPDPYAPGAPDSHAEWFYRPLRIANSLESVANRG